MLQPELVQRYAVEGAPDLTELVEIALTGRGPTRELDAELVGGVGLAKELRLVDAELLVELEDWRDRAFADTDGADRLGLDENDSATAAAEESRERCGRHPAGRSSADDDDAPEHMFSHGRNAPVRCGSG